MKRMTKFNLWAWDLFLQLQTKGKGQMDNSKLPPNLTNVHRTTNAHRTSTSYSKALIEMERRGQAPLSIYHFKSVSHYI